MKRTLLVLVLVLACGSIASAQQPIRQPARQPVPQPATTPELTPAVTTPDMWYYSQEQRRHDDPRQAVRRKAEFVSQQRAARIAAMKWYGMSNSRPVASTTPFMGVYSPAWVGNGGDRFDWINWHSLGYPQQTALYASPTLIVR